MIEVKESELFQFCDLKTNLYIRVHAFGHRPQGGPPHLNLSEKDYIKYPVTKFSEMVFITYVIKGKLPNKKFSCTFIQKMQLKLVT